MTLLSRPAYQTRVIEEQSALSERLERLRLFVNGAVFSKLSSDEQSRLHQQAYYMLGYNRMLQARIAAFEGLPHADD